MKNKSDEEKAKEIYAKFFRTTPQPYYNEKHGELIFQEWDNDWTKKMAKEQAILNIICQIDLLNQISFRNYTIFNQRALAILMNEIRELELIKTEIEKL